MRKVAIFTLAFGLIASDDAFAQTKGRDVNNVGCGLGAMAWEGKSGVVPQVLAATTNGTFGTQTFGITSETSGCAPNGKVIIPDKSTVMFIGPNLDRLAQDMSRGDGETLATLAEVMRIAPEDRSAFCAATQENFERIMPTDNVTAGEVAVSLYAVMSEDPVLRRYAVS
jgi:Protein of unknown function (DUF3015)